VGQFTEFVVEQAALAWLESLGWSVKHGLEIAPGEPGVGGAQSRAAGRGVVGSLRFG
jgi:hypothetical protein